MQHGFDKIALLGQKRGAGVVYSLLSSTYWLFNGGILYEPSHEWETDI